MERKIFKQSLRFVLLFTLKEVYLTCRNLLGLIYHPFKTIKVIDKERDPIQIFFIFGLPFYFWVGGAAAIIIGRFLIKAPFWQFGMLAKISLLTLSLISGAIFAYLSYWFFIYIKKRRSF